MNTTSIQHPEGSRDDAVPAVTRSKHSTTQGAPVRRVVRALPPPGDAATRLQLWWRRELQARKELFEAVVQEMMLLREAAAEVIQSAWTQRQQRRAARPQL
mmetsp:Transcript_72283/g.172348  ORF Transcript_72283/g.172348 Transcript_72283/m.172348 type:complete len:101 (+) Transcript_72283:138-440(+)|eukprot:CAMPEP_0178417210 /NCGR_PEP_ID=MMETSP0689_2-20121128/24457_1 /TAXON_ID=160604 /ORGANISM="Amphidinium massartii, Strain CS-259" /LENGTH=100 /DNA_ID=CAMNT_0020038569 /DNA_START=58 /DNA_END=360 /DNA_ORIENTATION=-